MHSIQRTDRMLICLVVNLVLLLFTGSSNTYASEHPLRSSRIDNDSKIERELQVQGLPPPKNDNCTGAMVIPSNFLGDTYTTPGVNINTATRSTGEPFHTCFIANITKDLWYKYTPFQTDTYKFSTNQGDTKFASAYFRQSIRDTPEKYCKNAKLFCQDVRPYVDYKLFANLTYLVFVQPAWTNTSGQLQLTVQRRRPPSNYLCTNATIFNPIGESLFPNKPYGKVDPKNYKFPRISVCSSVLENGPQWTNWYKFTNPLSTKLKVDVTAILSKINQVIGIGITKGRDCNTLQCVGGTFRTNPVPRSNITYDFFAAPKTSYYIFVVSHTFEPFDVSINGQTQYFTVIDSQKDKSIEKLRSSIDYFLIESSSNKLNIEAQFSASPSTLIKSVRLTYDNKRNVCDQKAPYTVFGDVKGNYNNFTIPLGQHKVTATPYAQPNCMGPAGTTTSQDFKVIGCYTQFSIVYASFPQAFESIILRPASTSYQFGPRPTKLPVNLSLPCKVTLLSTIYCGFTVQSFRAELRNANNNQLIVSRPHDRTKGSDITLINNDRLAAGSYTLRVFIDNIVHPAMNFTVVNTTCDS